MQAAKLVAMSLEEEIDSLVQQKEIQFQALSKLGKNKTKFETQIMALVADFSTQIEVLRNNITRNEKNAAKIAE